MSRVTCGYAPTAAPIAGLPGASRYTPPGSSTSFGLALWNPLADIAPPDTPLSMLPWKLMPVEPLVTPTAAPVPLTMLFAIVTSLGWNRMPPSPTWTGVAWSLTKVLNATSAWSTASWSRPLVASSRTSPPPTCSASPVLFSTTLLITTWLLPNIRMPVALPIR